MLTTREYANGHYAATYTPWATDYVWVPGEEEVEGRLLHELLVPGAPLTPCGPK